MILKRKEEEEEEEVLILEQLQGQSPDGGMLAMLLLPIYWEMLQKPMQQLVHTPLALIVSKTF